jgi:hypothetical protein
MFCIRPVLTKAGHPEPPPPEAWHIFFVLRSAKRCAPAYGSEEGVFSLLTQHLPLQRALRALGHAGLTSRRASGASTLKLHSTSLAFIAETRRRGENGGLYPLPSRGAHMTS